MGKRIGVLTAGGDTPGLNAAIRSLGKGIHRQFGINLVGFHDGFRGLMENRTKVLDENALSGILTIGGTILGTSRDKPHRMPVGGKFVDKTEVIVQNYRKHQLDALVCLGGGGTQKNALRLAEHGLNIITLPKTIDNDVPLTDITFGFDTALGIATEAIDRLHSTAHSHHRIIVVEIMGHRVGWLALGAGVAGGADVILIPEIPYDVNKISEAILRRKHSGKHFSIVAVAEGALTQQYARDFDTLRQQKKRPGLSKEEKAKIKSDLIDLDARHEGNTMRLSEQLEQLTGLESRVTILGHLQRGGTPSAADRLLATRLGSTCVDLIAREQYGVMVAARGNTATPVPLADVAGRIKYVPQDHCWIECARKVGTCLGD